MAPSAIRLMIVDLDGTLIEVNSWQYLHERLGTWDRGRVHLERYLAGEISYEEWAQLDAGLWRGVELGEVERILSEAPVRRGAGLLIDALRASGIRVGIVSAGLLPLARALADRFGMDFCLANDLEARDGRLTGRAFVSVPLERKGEVMLRMCDSLGIPPWECGSIGDSIHDFPPWMGLRIAVCGGGGLDSVDASIGDDLSEAIPYIIGPRSPMGERGRSSAFANPPAEFKRRR